VYCSHAQPAGYCVSGRRRPRRQLLRATAAALPLTPVLPALTPAVVALALGKLPAA